VDLALLERALSLQHTLATASLRDSPDPTTVILPPGLQDTPQEELGDLMYPPEQQQLTASSSTTPSSTLTALQQQQMLLSPPLDADLQGSLAAPITHPLQY
jgi:hypothetical protein